MSQIRTSALRLLVGASLFTFSANLVTAQDAQQLLDQGMSAYHQGDYEAARSKFREIVASNPANADALQMLHNSEDALLELLVAGGEFETFAREVLAAARVEGRDKIRDESAAAAAAEDCFSDSYAKRAQAIFALSQNYGPFGAVPLVAALGDASESKRLAAIYALSRMGSNVLLPVLAASHSTNTEVRLGTLHVLHALSLADARCAARIADMAANDADGSVQAMASSISTANGGVAGALANQGLAYFYHDLKLGLSPVENYGVLWTIDGRNLQAYDLPQEVVELEMAKHYLLRAMELGSASGADLALVYASQIAVLHGLVQGGADLNAQLTAQSNALLTINHEDVNRALHMGVDGGHIAASEVLIHTLDGAGGKEWSGFQAALASPVPSVSHSAAIALAHQGDYSDVVISNLAAALSLDAQRVVHIIDQDDRRATQLAADLSAMGIDVVRAKDGANGLVNMNLGINVDAFVLANPLSDLYTSRVISTLRLDPRFGATPVFVYANENNGDLDANVVESLDAGGVQDSFMDLDAERERYITIATDAAKTLAHAAHKGQAGAAVAAMSAALSRADSIATYAAYGLGFAGDGSAAPALANLVADTSRDSGVRAAAANALANLYARSGAAVDASIFQSAMMEGDAALAEACARAIGVMAGGHLSAGVSVQ